MFPPPDLTTKEIKMDSSLKNEDGIDYIYTRVSSDRQTTETQISELKVLYPNAIVIDEIASTRFKRKKLDDLLKKLKAGDRLIVWRLDRIVRSVMQFCEIVEMLKKKDVIFISEKDGIDMSTASGRLQANVLAMMAQYERDLISQRTKEGLAMRKARHGGKHPPKPSPSGGRGKIRVFHSPVKINKIFDLQAKGHNWREIAYLLRAHNKSWEMTSQACYRLFKKNARSRETQILKVV